MEINDTHIFDVDIKHKNYINEPEVTQNDKVVFILRLTDNGLPFDLSGVSTYTLVSVRPDKQSVQTLGVKTDTNEITFNLGSTEIAVPGQVNAAIQIYDAGGRVSSIPFSYMVLNDMVEDYVPSENEQTLIELVLGEGPAILAAAQQATTVALEAAEGVTQAIVDTTAVKDATEAVRVATEAERLATESERMATEAERLLTVSERNATESVRLATEAERLATETVRTDTIAVKNDTETVKNATELVRQATETERLATVDIGVGLMTIQQQSINLNTASETATAEAITAKDNADAATGFANTAGQYANTQGQRAEVAADTVEGLLEDGAVASVNGQTGIVTITPENIGAATEQYVDESHKYGNKFEWQYNAGTDSLDLVVLSNG